MSAREAELRLDLGPGQLGSGPVKDQLERLVQRQAAGHRDDQEEHLAPVTSPGKQCQRDGEQRDDDDRRAHVRERAHDRIKGGVRQAVEQRRHERVERACLLIVDVLGD